MTNKVLGQVAPTATTETDLYAVPSGKSSVVSSIFIANRGSTETTFRVSVSVGGGATQNKEYIYYDIPIAGNDTFASTTGITLAETDVVRVYAGNGNLSVSLFGKES